MKINIDTVLTLKLPETAGCYIGRKNGSVERIRLELDERDQALLVDQRYNIHLHLLPRSHGLITNGYLLGLLGPSVQKLGTTHFLEAYRLFEGWDKPLLNRDLPELVKQWTRAQLILDR